MNKYHDLNKRLSLYTSISLLIIISLFTNYQQLSVHAADTNADYQHALATTPKGLNWDNNAFVIADFTKAADKRLGRTVDFPQHNIYNSSLVNNAEIVQSTNPATPNTSVIKMTNNTYQTGAVWSNMATQNYFDISHEQKASMWLYFGKTNPEDAFTGDGMAFVLQNDPNGENSIALSADGIPVNGQALGVWGADWDPTNQYYPQRLADTAIQNSWALEFDTFVNYSTPTSSRPGEGLAFDFDFNGNSDRHIAGNYPALKTTYKTNSYFPNYFVMDHGLNAKKRSNLVDSNWHHVTVTWTPQNTDTGVLSYAYNDKDPVTGVPITNGVVKTSFDLNTKNFGLTGDNTKLYWGFTGSTGRYSENNLMIFESIPSYVDAEATSTIYDDTQGGSKVNDNDFVDPNSDVRYKYSLNYKGWTRDWDKITATMDVPQHVKFTSGTITYPGSSTDKNPRPIPEDVFTDSNASKLTYLLPEKLTPTSRSAVIELHGKTEKIASTNLTVPSAHASFDGDNLITDANSVSYKIRSRAISLDSDSPNPIKVNENEDAKVSGQVTYLNNSVIPDYGSMVVHQVLNNNAPTTLGNIIDSSGKFQFSIDHQLLDKINTLSFYVTDKDGLSSNTLSRQIVVGGALAFGNVQADLKFRPVNGSFSNQIIPRLGNWQIEVVDSRDIGTHWTVQASSTGLLDSKNGLLNGHLIFRNTNGDHSLFDNNVNVATNTKNISGTQTTNITDTWTSNSGILLAMNKGNPSGIYNGQITWSLLDTTPNI